MSYDDSNLAATTTIIGDADAPSKSVTTYQDVMGRTTEEIAHGDAQSKVEYKYDCVGNKTSEKNSREFFTTWEYDHAGRVTKEVNHLGESMSIFYDALGNKESEKDYSGAVTNFQYDTLGRCKEESRTMIGTQKSVVKSGYDAAGNLVMKEVLSASPEKWRRTEYKYDSGSLMTDIILHEENGKKNWTRIDCDAKGNKVATYTGMSSRDDVGNAQVTRQEYDRLGNVVMREGPDKKTELFEYDALGTLLSKTDLAGGKTTFTYDVLDRLVKQRASSGSGSVTVLEYDYAKAGEKVREAVYTQGADLMEILYQYDSKGNLVNQTETGGVKKEFTYDPCGNREDFRLYRGNVLEVHLGYEYDALNRMKKLFQGDKNSRGICIADYDYYPGGRRKKLTYPQNNIITQYTYNTGGLVTRLETTKEGNSVFLQENTYYPDGNIQTKTQQGKTTQYRYDLLGRIVQETNEQDTVTYSYDPFSNRKTMGEKPY